ncbi:hypothetical protein AB0O75_39110 [Streptomyces sp. NPDC088921]|uniref:hypothetical protein n=1 Tax=unclassified Streptomyces TaxID=2593676 RepID=UPI00342A69ED
MRSLDASTIGSWVTVTGTWIPDGRLGSDEAWPPVLSGASGNQVKQPDCPYEMRSSRAVDELLIAISRLL